MKKIDADGFDGKVVIVTGCANGLGKEIAIEFGRRGANVALFDNIEPVETIRRLKESHSSFISCIGDITDEGSVREFLKTVFDKFGEVDILINNAGIHFSGNLESTSPKDLIRVLNVNVVGTFIMTREAVKYMKKCDISRIINISSSAAFDNIKGTGAYACSKAAVNSLTQTIAKELTEFGITVNSICPTVIATQGFYEKAKEKSSQLGIDEESLIKDYSMGINIQHRVLMVNEALDAVFFLCSKMSKGITGTSLLLNCGSFMR